jgi:hypothetical protein
MIESIRKVSLSLGERDGVRASVHPLPLIAIVS